ncbi:ABC transporter transmembrane domain-containing protein [uncultured Xylophilus sp.]|uniref:ABC transporter transmembrane domain-containing protein n=1 Tax=uncultured Xylophilus sp. TaxID=296832 RepID=UPI0025E85EAB|nr:ABC transporter transmembrane domain-containing protein [uncultured Xylophilus sp.]
MSPVTAPPRPSKSPRSLGGLRPFLRPYRWQIGIALLMLALAAGATLAFPLALRGLVDGGLSAASDASKRSALPGHFLALFGVSVVLGLASAGRFYMVSWLGERVSADVRNAIYAHVLRQSPQFFETTQSGEVLSRLTADTTLVQTVIGSSFSMGLRNGVMGLGALAVLVYTHPWAMLQVAAGLLLVVLPSVAFGRRVRRLSRASQDRIADASAIAAEVLNAVPLVQSYTAEGREADRFAASTEAAFGTAVRRSRARAALVAFIIVATSGALLWGLYQGAQAVLDGRLTAGQLGQTVVYVAILASAAAVLGEVYGDLLRAAGATERLMELLHSRSPVASPDTPVVPNLDAKPDFAPAPPAGAAIEFEAIDFHYPSRPGTAALQGLSLQVAAGETVALVGASGAGKTTVFQLLQRFYDVDPGGGAIRLDGVNLRHLDLHALRSRIGVVPQDPTVFSATARENIRYGRPDASDAEVEAAARAAFAHDFLAALPQGYDTFLGERGVRLSGGQRQRIAIARALLKDPPLLLLDEATSALDAESERMVQAALDAAIARGEGRRTTLVIAHRLATVQNADRIVVLDQGRLVEQGTHAALLAAGGAYARLAALQFTA